MRRLPTHAHAHNSILTFRDLLMRRMIMWVCMCTYVRTYVRARRLVALEGNDGVRARWL